MSGFAIQRTAKQKDADALDLTVFRCIGALLQFADDHKDPQVREMGLIIGTMRHRVQKHMHAGDRTTA